MKKRYSTNRLSFNFILAQWPRNFKVAIRLTTWQDHTDRLLEILTAEGPEDN